MPTYQYKCPNCGASLEVFRKITEDTSKTPCPSCGALAYQELSPTAFLLKGGGWYSDGYSKNAGKENK